MWPFADMTEPEPVLAELGPVWTITRTEAFSARTKAGSRPPAGFGWSAGAAGFGCGADVGVGAGGAGVGAAGFAATFSPARTAGFAVDAGPDVAGGAGVAVAAIEIGRKVGVGVAVDR